MTIFTKKVIDACIGIFIYVAGSMVLMLGGISVMTGKFPPPISETIGKIKNTQKTILDLQAMQGMMQAQQQRSRTIDSALNENLEVSINEDDKKIKPVDSAQVLSSQEQKDLNNLKIEFQFLKSQVLQAMIELEQLKKTCQVTK